MVVPDYQMLEYPRPLIMWNPRLISEDVGVGFNVRKLRRSFLRTFSVVYSMRPFAAGAVFRCYPGLWKVFYDDKDRPGRYLLAKELISRPDTEELEEKAEEGPSLFARAAGIFSSLNRFMRVITK
ncbi:Protein LOW PSII ACCUMULATION 3 chloroplastic [Bienertia sinuspersici]